MYNIIMIIKSDNKIKIPKKYIIIIPEYKISVYDGFSYKAFDSRSRLTTYL